MEIIFKQYINSAIQNQIVKRGGGFISSDKTKSRWLLFHVVMSRTDELSNHTDWSYLIHETGTTGIFYKYYSFWGSVLS